MSKFLRLLSSNKFLLGGIVFITLVHWVIFAFKIPIIVSLPHWFWKFISKPIGPLWQIGLLLAGTVAAVYFVLKNKGSPLGKVVLLFLLGIFLQFGFALLEGRGVDAIKDRIVKSGHAEFAWVAVEQENIYHLITHYEELLESDKLGTFAKSKPPGQLLFYILTSRVANLFADGDSYEEKLRALETFATYCWPVLSCIVLFPLFYLARILLGEGSAIIVCLLYLLVPSVNLMTLHADQVIFPLFFTVALLCSVMATQRNSLPLAILAGGLVYLSAWFTFALVFVLLFIAAYCYLLKRDEGGEGYTKDALKLLFCVGVGMLAVDLLMRTAFNYDIFLRYKNASYHHLQWREAMPNLKYRVYHGVLNFLEYALWVGIPLFFMFAIGLFRSARSCLEKKLDLASVTPLAMGVILLYVAFLSNTKGEIARLCLFLVPPLCITAAHVISTQFKENKLLVVWMVVLLQWGTVYLTKVNQDFW